MLVFLAIENFSWAIYSVTKGEWGWAIGCFVVATASLLMAATNDD